MRAFLKWFIGIIIGILIILIAALITLGILLKPQRLAGLVHDYAPRFVNADVYAKSIDLSFWSTFPRLTVDIDSLLVISHTLDSAPPSVKAELPQWSDTLLQAKSFKGSINIPKLLKKDIEIYDIDIQSPQINLVVATPMLSNYDIMVEDSEEDSSDGMSDISLRHIKLTEAGPLRYTSIPDSLNICAELVNLNVNQDTLPFYSLTTSGNLQSDLLERYNIKDLKFRLDGGVSFDFKDGLTGIEVTDLIVDIDSVNIVCSTSVSLTDSITLNSLDLAVNNLNAPFLSAVIPHDMADLSNLQSDISASLNIRLTEPYTIDTVSLGIPSALVDIDIPRCNILWPQWHIKLNGFELLSHINLVGSNLNRSEIELKRLIIDGQAIDINLRALITQPITNPRVAGELKGRLIFDRLPRSLMAQLPATVNGTIGLNTAFRLLQSQLNARDFHKIFLKGVISLRDFSVAYAHKHEEEELTDSLYLYTPLTMFRFDSDKTVESNGVKIDSLLSLTLTSDSLYYAGDGMFVAAKNLETSLGTKNTATSSDTTKINPFGGHIAADRLSIISNIDSTRLSFRNFTADASLSRFHNLDKVPVMNLSASARRISMGTPGARFTISQPAFTVKANLNPRRSRHYHGDSIRNHAVKDSLKHRSATHRKQVSETNDTTAGLKNLLRRWNVTGQFTARRGRLFTSAFPINNTFSKIDLDFSTDSIILNSLRLKAGSSDFNFTGRITDIRKSMTRNSRHNPLRMEFAVVSDTIDIDQISRAVFAGAAADRDTSLWNSSVDDTVDVSHVIDIDTTATAALIIPPDIDASLTVRASNVIYSDFFLHKFSGELGVWDQAIHLHDLYATSDVGNLGFSAIYNAPDTTDLEFGMGMQLVDFHLERFLQVTPAIAELLPAMHDFSGVINAEIALTSGLNSQMDFIIPSMQADIKIDGDSLVLLDADTFKSLSKWLMFKNKKRNLIDHMSVELQVDSSQVILFPFIFNIDRYKLGVMGSNDLDMNFNYHVSVLKSPIPFKFGINISGNPDKYKIRLGGAKVNENSVVERVAISSETRINLVNQIENVFRRSAQASGRRLNVHTDRDHAGELRKELNSDAPADTLSVQQLNELEVPQN